MKNRYVALEIKIVLIRKLASKIFKIKKDIKTEIISNKIIENLSSKFDLTHFNLGPMAIANKNGIRKGTINLW